MAVVAEKKKRAGLFGRFKEKQRLLEEKHVQLTGVRIQDTPAMVDVKKRYFIFTNALINFLVVIGTLGCFMETFDVSYNMPLVMAAGAVFALFTAFLYMNTVFKLLGYIASFVGFMYGIIHLRYMIRGGFAYICNEFMEFLEKEFGLPIERSYEVYGYEEKLSVTMCLIFIVFATMLLLNMSISESKNFELVFLFTFPIVQIGMYFDLKVNIWYFSMYMIGILTLFFLRNSNHCHMESRKKKGYLRRKRNEKVVFDYVTDGKYSFSFLIVLSAVLIVISLIISILSPQKNFKMSTRYDELKYNTREFTERLALVGFWGMFNPDGSAGGVGRNKMGQSKYVRLDYEDDLIVRTFAERMESHMYLKSFNGTFYKDAMWETLSEQKDVQVSLKDYNLTARELENLTVTLNQYYGGGYLGAKKAIHVMNVGATSSYTYLPYHLADDMQNVIQYVNDDETVGGLPRNYIQVLNYQPIRNIRYVDEFREKIKKENELAIKNAEENSRYHYRLEALDKEAKYSEYVHEVYMQVPQENLQTIQNFCDKYDLSGDSEDIVEKLAFIFERDYEYSLIPGKTPSNKEFVNYFLEEQKKGYCMYFATASTLILRYLGIPARFTGGYVLWNSYYPTGDVRELRENETLGDWVSLDEYSEDRYPYGLMEYKLDDSMAHAWVEIYIDGFGWIPVEFTPPSEDEPDKQQEADQSANVLRFLADNVFTAENMNNMRNASIGLFYTGITLVMAGIILYIIVGILVRSRRRNTKSVPKLYEYLCMCSGYIGIKREPSMAYAEYARLLTDQGIMQEEQIDRITRILEKDKYSKENACEEEVRFVTEQVTGVSDQIYHQLKWYQRLWYRYIKWL